MDGKVILRHTRLLPVICPPGTSNQPRPFQYCTRKSLTPYCVNVIDGVGSAGDA
jgi:hypothetical protein